MPRLALYQPDIPQNVGAAMRLCACLGVALDLIEPFGFVWDDRKIAQAGLDYIDRATITRHPSWESFRAVYPQSRLILLSTKAAQPYTTFSFQEDDILLAGRESAGVPDDVHHAATARVLIPMATTGRSLNVVVSSAMVLGEALRQTQQNGHI